MFINILVFMRINDLPWFAVQLAVSAVIYNDIIDMILSNKYIKILFSVSLERSMVKALVKYMIICLVKVLYSVFLINGHSF